MCGASIFNALIVWLCRSLRSGLGTTSGGAGNYEPLVFGANSWNSGNWVSSPLKEYFSGLLDEVAIFDRALTDREIGHLYRAAIPEPGTLALLFIGALAALRGNARAGTLRSKAGRRT